MPLILSKEISIASTFSPARGVNVKFSKGRIIQRSVEDNEVPFWASMTEHPTNK